MTPTRRDPSERLGAHVSTAGGVQTAPGRGRAIGATAIQVFTKTPSQWKEPALSEESVREFRRNLDSSDIREVVSHDSYLINLASPNRVLTARSRRSFIAELTRCETLGIRWVVSHPGNYMINRESGLERNAREYSACLRAVPGEVRLLIEGTAGTGTALGSSFEELAALREAIGADVRDRVGFCLDTCHLYSAGYDLVKDYEGVWARWEAAVGLGLLGCLHLNDSKTPFASRRDRHELIAEGSLGAERSPRTWPAPGSRATPKTLQPQRGAE